MSAETPPEEQQTRLNEARAPAWAQDMDAALAQLDWPVWLGRISGFLIVVISLAVGIKVGGEEYPFISDFKFWNFLAAIVAPLGIGFLILVMTEVLNRLSRISR